MLTLHWILRKSLMALAVLAIGAPCFGQDLFSGLQKKQPLPDFTFDLAVPKGSTTGTFKVSAKIPKNPRIGSQPYHVFSMRTSGGVNGPRATKISLDENSPWETLDGDYTADRRPESHDEEEINDEGKSVLAPVEYYEGHVTWSRKLRLRQGVSADNVELSGTVSYQICDDKSCRRPKLKFKVAPRIVERVAEVEPKESVEPVLTAPGNDNPPEAVAPAGREPAASPAASKSGNSPSSAVLKTSAGDASSAREITGINKSQGLFWFLVTAAAAGFAALLTPCVFPMVPITISFFNKQAEKEHHQPMTMAFVYCLGIMGTFTVLGVVMSVMFGPASLNQLANNAWFNIFLAGMLVFFGLSLLGMYDIRMPSWLLTATSGQQSRGGYLGVLFMALTFTLTSFTCTFAFAGGLLVAATQGDRLWPILGLLAFSAAFSLPFFFLALFPSLLQKLPRSGGWMNVIKVIMGMVEIGAAFKFLSVADLAWNPVPWFFDYELVIASWMVISVTTAAYLLGMYRLPHDQEANPIGVSRLVVAMSFLGLGAYMAIGLFASDKPNGILWENIVAFAPPKFERADAANDEKRPDGPFRVHGGLSYALDVQKAVDFAVRENRPLLLEFTGVNCVNCRKMENGPMQRSDTRDRLTQFVRVQLFTDRVPKVTDPKEAQRLAEQNRKLQEKWYGDVTLPAYVIVPPLPKILESQGMFLGGFVGMESVQEQGSFTRFLDDGLSRWRILKLQQAKGQPIGQSAQSVVEDRQSPDAGLQKARPQRPEGHLIGGL